MKTDNRIVHLLVWAENGDWRCGLDFTTVSYHKHCWTLLHDFIARTDMGPRCSACIDTITPMDYLNAVEL